MLALNLALIDYRQAAQELRGKIAEDKKRDDDAPLCQIFGGEHLKIIKLH
jgi:hypothetical protein